MSSLERRSGSATSSIAPIRSPESSNSSAMRASSPRTPTPAGAPSMSAGRTPRARLASEATAPRLVPRLPPRGHRRGVGSQARRRDRGAPRGRRITGPCCPEEGVDETRLAEPVWSDDRWSASRTRRRALTRQLARRCGGSPDDRGDLLEGDGEQVVQHERDPLGRGEAVKHDQQRQPDGVRQERPRARGRARSRLESGSAKSSSRVEQLGRSRAARLEGVRQTRETTVVSQAPRFSTPLVSERLKRIHASCSASSASVLEPSIREASVVSRGGVPRRWWSSQVLSSIVTFLRARRSIYMTGVTVPV